jgi:hypothetical protein
MPLNIEIGPLCTNPLSCRKSENQACDKIKILNLKALTRSDTLQAANWHLISFSCASLEVKGV